MRERRFEQRHIGLGADVAERQRVYAAARAQHPARWCGATRNWTPVTTVRLNPTKDDLLTQGRTAA